MLVGTSSSWPDGVGDMFEDDPEQRWFGSFADGARAAVQFGAKWYYGPLLAGLFLEVYDAAVKSSPVTLETPYWVI